MSGSPNFVFRCPAAVLEVVVVVVAVVVAAVVDIDSHRVAAVGCHRNFRLVRLVAVAAADTVDFRSVVAVGCHNSFRLEAAVPAAHHSETLVALLVERMLQVVAATQPLMEEDLAVEEGGHQQLADEDLQEAEAILQELLTLVWGL